MAQPLHKYGIVALRSEPGRLVAMWKTFKNTHTGHQVTVIPMPSIAEGGYIREGYHGLHTKYDTILCEDGTYPVTDQSREGQSIIFWRRLIPFFAFRMVVPQEALSHYQGEAVRDVLETKMAHESVKSGMNPLVDPRARRGIEKLLVMDPGKTVVLPWNMWHAPYLTIKLKEHGYEEVASVEKCVMEQRYQMLLLMSMFTLAFWSVMTLMQLIFWMMF